MKYRLKKTVALLLAMSMVFGNVGQSFAATATAKNTVTYTAKEQKLISGLDALVKDFQKNNSFSGAIILSQNGKVLLNKGYGYANEEYGVANGPKTVFRLASLTKQLTAAAALKLEEQGKWNLDDPVVKYAPDFSNDKVTIRMLLNHTSGIQDQIVQTGKTQSELMMVPHTAKELYGFIKNEKIVTEPGKKYYYSNHNYMLMGYLIETVSGKSYEAYIKENFLTPLGIKDIQLDDGKKVIKNRAEGYSVVKGTRQKATYIDMSNPFSAGGLVGTTESYLKWQQNYYNTKLLTKKSWDEMFDTSVSSNALPLMDERYGLGVALLQMPIAPNQNTQFIYHTGAINGFRNFQLHISALKLDFVMLSNCDSFDLASGLYKLLMYFVGGAF